MPKVRALMKMFKFAREHLKFRGSVKIISSNEIIT